MDKTCETCRFWLRQYDGDENGWRVCDRANSGPDGVPEGVRGRMYVTAADDYELALYTAGDFGCTEWRAIGDGIPTRVSRFGWLRKSGAEDFNTFHQPAPEHPAGFTDVVKREVSVPEDARRAWLSVEVVGEELFEQTWAEAITEARQLLDAFYSVP